MAAASLGSRRNLWEHFGGRQSHCNPSKAWKQQKSNNRLISQPSSLKTIQREGEQHADKKLLHEALADGLDSEVQAVGCFVHSRQLFISWLPPRQAEMMLSLSLPAELQEKATGSIPGSLCRGSPCSTLVCFNQGGSCRKGTASLAGSGQQSRAMHPDLMTGLEQTKFLPL